MTGRTLAIVLALGLGMAATSDVQAQDLARGEVLFELCAQCHGAEAGGVQEFEAPAIAGLSQWYLEAQLTKFRNGLRGRHFDDVQGMRMRPMSRTLKSEDDLKAVAAYVAQLPAVQPSPTVEGGDAAKGATLFAPCTQCHGAAGEGVQALNGAPLAHQSDWYLVSSLRKFKAGIRGSDPRDAAGILMRPMASILVDEQAVKDVVAHIMTLSNP